jgi:hypothetical protein
MSAPDVGHKPTCNGLLEASRVMCAVVHEHVEITEKQGHGYSYRALKLRAGGPEIRPSTSLLSVPESLLLTSQAANSVVLAHSLAPSLKLTEAGLISLALGVIKRCAAAHGATAGCCPSCSSCSPWRPYVDLCLTPSTASTLLHHGIPGGAEAMLEQTPMGLSLSEAREDLIRQCKVIAADASVAAAGLSWEDIFWGHSHYCSRAMAVPAAAGNAALPSSSSSASSLLPQKRTAFGNPVGSNKRPPMTTVPAMVPVADFANHDPKASTSLGGPYFERRLQAAADGTAAPRASLHLVCGSRAIKSSEGGSEIFISYGHKSNAELLAHYGFALDSENKADCVHLRVLQKPKPAEVGRGTTASFVLELAKDPICKVSLIAEDPSAPKDATTNDSSSSCSPVFTLVRALPCIDLLEWLSEALSPAMGAQAADSKMSGSSSTTASSWLTKVVGNDLDDDDEVGAFLRTAGENGKRAVTICREQLGRIRAELTSVTSLPTSSPDGGAAEVPSSPLLPHLLAYRLGLVSVIDSQLAYLGTAAAS